jgi:hypothetical protein
VGAEPDWVDDDRDLALPAADDVDGADPLRALEDRLEDVLGDAGQLLDGERPGDRELGDGDRPEVELLDDGRVGFARQLPDRRLDLVADVVCRGVEGDVEVELQDDDRDALVVLRADRVQARERVERLLRGSETFRSTVSGSAPRRMVVTVSVGNSTGGNWSTPMRG